MSTDEVFAGRLQAPARKTMAYEAFGAGFEEELFIELPFIELPFMELLFELLMELCFIELLFMELCFMADGAGLDAASAGALIVRQMRPRIGRLRNMKFLRESK